MAYGKKWVIRRHPSHPILRYFSGFKVRLLLMQRVLREKRARDNCHSVNVSNNPYIKLTWLPIGSRDSRMMQVGRIGWSPIASSEEKQK